MTTEAYPLYWPEGRPRTDRHRRENARFATSFARARDEVIHQIELLVGRYQVRTANVVVSINIALRRDGLPLASQRAPDDPGVAVYFTYKKRQMCFACDRWKKIEDNMQAITKTIEALPSPNSVRTWREVLGLTSGPQSMEQVVAAYRRLRSEHHPDKGGDSEKFNELQRAYTQAESELLRATQ